MWLADARKVSGRRIGGVLSLGAGVSALTGAEKCVFHIVPVHTWLRGIKRSVELVVDCLTQSVYLPKWRWGDIAYVVAAPAEKPVNPPGTPVIRVAARVWRKKKKCYTWLIVNNTRAQLLSALGYTTLTATAGHDTRLLPVSPGARAMLPAACRELAVVEAKPLKHRKLQTPV